MLTLIGYKNPSDLSILIKYINNIALKNDIKQIFCISERNHPMRNSLKEFIRISNNISLYVKPIKENLELHESPVFIDGIDM